MVKFLASVFPVLYIHEIIDVLCGVVLSNNNRSSVLILTVYIV